MRLPWKKQSEVERQFGKLVAPKVLARILEMEDGEPEPPRPGLVRYLIVQVKDDDLGKLAQALEETTQIVREGGAMLEGIMLSLVFVTSSVPTNLVENTEACAAIAKQLVQNLPNDVKVVVGETDGVFGITGPSRFSQMGSLFPGFSAALEALVELDYGEIKRL